MTGTQNDKTRENAISLANDGCWSNNASKRHAGQSQKGGKACHRSLLELEFGKHYKTLICSPSKATATQLCHYLTLIDHSHPTVVTTYYYLRSYMTYNLTSS